MLNDPVVAANFHRGADHTEHQRRRHAAVLDLVKNLRGSVLDVGCGYGDLTWAVSKVLGPVQGVDVDPARVAFAREQYAPIPFSVCREDGLDFADASFDNVTSIVVLPFVADVDAHVSELYRVLKPGGHLLLATRTSSWLSRLRRRISGTPASPKLHHRTLDGAKQLLQKHEFEIETWGAIYDPPFHDRRNFGDLVSSTVEWVGAMAGAVNLAQYPIVLARRTG